MRRDTPQGAGTDPAGRSTSELVAGTPDVTALLRQFIEDDYVHVVAAVGLITHDRDRAESAVQDAMVRLLTERGPEDDTPLATWITTTASTTDRDLVPDSPSVLARDDTADTVVSVVRSLPLPQRQTAVMHYYLDAPVVDIASGMGVSEEQVAADLRAVGASIESALGTDDPQDDNQERAS
ncbi:MAG: RNA polymerase sigma factor [Actinomycetes bacterium]